MDRYISAELAIEKCNKLLENASSCPNPAVLEGVELVKNLILSDCETGVPTEDISPVIRGRWIIAGTFDDFAKCSVCGITALTLHEVLGAYGDRRYRFCPFCGAEMDLGRVTGEPAINDLEA